MTTVVLDKIRVELTAEQIIAAFRQLPPEEQKKVSVELVGSREREVRQLLDRIQMRAEQLRAEGIPELTDDEIDEEIRIVREERRARQYAQSSD